MWFCPIFYIDYGRIEAHKSQDVGPDRQTDRLYSDEPNIRSTSNPVLSIHKNSCLLPSCDVMAITTCIQNNYLVFNNMYRRIRHLSPRKYVCDG